MQVKKRRLTSRSTAADVEKRVEDCELLLSRGIRKSQIHEAMRKKYGSSWQQCDRYLSRAREKMLLRLARARDEHRSDSLAFYESMLQSSDVKPHDKILARKQIDELLGLAAPKRHELSGDENSPIQMTAPRGIILELPALRPLGQPPANANGSHIIVELPAKDKLSDTAYVGNGRPNDTGSAVERPAG